MITVRKWVGLSFAPDSHNGEKDSRHGNPANWEPYGVPADGEIMEFPSARLNGRSLRMSREMLDDCILERGPLLPKREVL